MPVTTGQGWVGSSLIHESLTPPGSSLTTGDRKATGKAGSQRLAVSGPWGGRTDALTPTPGEKGAGS